MLDTTQPYLTYQVTQGDKETANAAGVLQGLSPHERHILMAYTNNPHLNVDELAYLTGYQVHTVHGVLDMLFFSQVIGWDHDA
jgi:DNA-binding MarR family transcriptional regulator